MSREPHSRVDARLARIANGCADRTFPLDNLSLTDLMILGAAIRAMSVRHSDPAALAGELVRLLYERVVNDRDQRALALVRLFETRRFAELDDELRAIAAAAYPGIRPETVCLVLVGTDDYVAKPIRRSELFDAIDRAIGTAAAPGHDSPS